MTNANETPISKDSIKVLAEVIASNDPMSSDVSAGPMATAPATVGMVLREGREKLGFSAGDIATKLRMGLKQVTALENSDFAALPTGTFLRGFVRNYAKAVALNDDEVLALLEKTNKGAAAVIASLELVPTQQNIKVPVPGGELATPKGKAFLVGAVLLLLLAAAWYWLEYVFPYRSSGGRTNSPVTQSIAVPPPAVLTEPSAPSAQSTRGELLSATTSSDVAANPVVAEPDAKTPSKTTQIEPSLAASPSSAPVIESLPARVASPLSGSASLGFTFNGESWVEVVDGTGKTVLSRRFASGDAEEVNGRAPFSIVIGNAKSTRMAFKGQEFDLAPHTRGAVARMTIK